MIFDLDGTLIDSAPDIAAAVNAALADRAVAIDAAAARRFLGDGARRLIARVLDAHDQPYSSAELDTATEAFSVAYQAHPCQDSTLFPGAMDALGQLREQGVRLAICTNKPQPIAERVVAHLGLDRTIEVIVGAGTHPLKPDPAPLHACLSALDCAPGDALYIGDMAVDRQAGHAAGLPVLLAEFGYAATPAGELGADGVLTAWPALTTAVDELRT